MQTAEVGKVQRLRSVLDNGSQLLIPLPSLCNDVEDAVFLESRKILVARIEKEYRSQSEELSSPAGTMGFSLANTRIHLVPETEASPNGFVLTFRLRPWPYSPFSKFAEVLSVQINGIGRIVKIVVEKHSEIPDLDLVADGFGNQLIGVAETWYASLEAYVDRLLKKLTTSVVEEMLNQVRIVVPPPHSDAVWLYAIVGDYGFSLTDGIARQRLLRSVRTQRGQFEASPLEAAISLIAVEMKRSLAFSTQVLQRGTETEITLPAAEYKWLIKNTERTLYGTDTVTALPLATTRNKDIGIIAAFPKGEAGDRVITPRLEAHRQKFQSILDRLGNQLRFLMGTVDRLTKGATSAEKIYGTPRRY